VRERIDDQQYFDTSTPEGVPVRYLHEGCSEKKSPCLVVTRTAAGWKYRCHRCGASGFRGLDGLSTREVVQFTQRDHTSPVVSEVTLPPPCRAERSIARTQEHAIAWLLKYGITDAEINRYRIYLADNYRLIIPVFDRDGKPIYWQGRSFTPGHQKWINQRSATRQNVFFQPNKEPGTDEVVLVEDMISAIKVNRVMDSIGLLGSYVPDQLVMDLAKVYTTIYLWLDADKAKESLARTKRYQSFGIPVKRIYTPKDPKEYTEEQITTIIDEA